MKKQQNIYDDPQFFAGYMALRAKTNSYNVLLDAPAIESLLPDLLGKSVLDLGCGFGDNCYKYISRGAAFVVGIDSSENMIAEARQMNTDAKIEFYVMDMMKIDSLGKQFDVIVSSLAIHYVEDFNGLMRTIAACLRPGGTLVFSQEHPIATAPASGVAYSYDENKKATYFHLQDYGRSGLRVRSWFDTAQPVHSYHRTMAEVMNGIIAAGLCIEEIVEPLPTPAAIEKNDGLYKEFIKPSFLAVRAKK